ncbi:hypothetical protein [Nocardioides marinquilinus]
MKPLLALLAVVAACVGLTAAPASAERVSGRDGRADVAQLDEESDRPTKVARPSGDLVGYAVRYGQHRISAVLRYRDLKPQGRRFFAGLIMTLPGAAGQDVGLQVFAGRGDRAGQSMLDVDDDERCNTRHRIDYRRDVVRLSTSARCLGRPRFIDAFVASVTYDRSYRSVWVDIAPGNYREFARNADTDENYPTVRVRRG